MAHAVSLSIDTITVRQLNGLYSLNDLHQASGGLARHEPNRFVRLDQTRELVAEISKSPEMGISADSRNCLETRRGAQGGTYACRELVIAYAAWISAAFHLKVIRVFLESTGQAQVQRETLNVTLARMADQLDQPNSYPVQVFMPLLHAINRKLLRNDVFGVTMNELVDVIEQSRPLSNLELANLASACTNRLAARINPAFQHLTA